MVIIYETQAMLNKALLFLSEHREIALATCKSSPATDGDACPSKCLPKLRIFQVMKQEGHVLYFATSAEKSVYKELQANPNVEILAYADNVSVRCSGMVNFNVDDNVKHWIYDNNPVLPRLYSSYNKLEYFCLPIAEIDYFDLTPTPPVFLHFDLIAGETNQGHSMASDPHICT